MNKRLILAVIFVVGLVGLSAATAAADPNLNDVPRHRHFVKVSATQMAEFGPRVCDNPNLQEAFNQFHNNLHVSAGWGLAAPGLHNGTGGEIIPGPC